MTHSQLKKAVIRSFLWSLSFELNKSVADDLNLSVMKKIAAISSVKSIVNIMLNECKKHNGKEVDLIEEIKMAAWNDLAERYREEEVVANIPTMIEEVFYHEYEWLSKIKNLESNIARMSRLAIDDTVKPKVSRIVTDEYFDILSKHVYRALKDEKGRAA